MKGAKELTELALIVVMVIACHATRKTSSMDAQVLPVFDKEAHRGGRGLMPENTIPAMLNAIDLGVTTLEMDAVITKDKQVILSHEPFYNHAITTKPDGKPVEDKEERSLNIFQMTYEETRGYDVGIKPYPQFPQQKRMAATKPLLSAVIDEVEAYTKKKKTAPVFYNIETKTSPKTDDQYHPAPAAFVDILMAVILQKKIAGRVIIQSFDFRTLQVLHQKYPTIMTSSLVNSNDKHTLDEQLALLGFTPTIYSPAANLVTPELIEACHKKEMKIVPWTVNDKAAITKLKEMGVDGVITDYPNLF